jgi:hypothetical protein
MKKIFLAILLCITCDLAFSQDGIVVLHPAIGDTIFQNEKVDFLLFPEIADSTFQFGQILKMDGAYYLLYAAEEEFQSIELDTLDIHKYHTNICKLSAYFNSKEFENYDNLEENFRLNQAEIIPSIHNIRVVTPEMLEALPKEVRRYQHLKFSAEDMGLWGDAKEDYIKKGSYIEIYSSKKKK